MEKGIFILLVICMVSVSCVSNFDYPINVKFIQLCPDSTSFNIVLVNSITPEILYSGLQYPNSSKLIQKTVNIVQEEQLRFHLEKVSDKTELLNWQRVWGTIIVGGRIDSLQSITLNPNSNIHLGDTTSLYFINAVRNSDNYDLWFGKQLLFKNMTYFLSDTYYDTCHLTTKLNKSDTFFVYRAGTNQMISYLPYSPFSSKGNLIIAISGMEGATDLKKLRMNIYPVNE